VIVSFQNGRMVREVVGPVKSGPLFNYLVSINSTQLVDLELGLFLFLFLFVLSSSLSDSLVVQQ